MDLLCGCHCIPERCNVVFFTLVTILRTSVIPRQIVFAFTGQFIGICMAERLMKRKRPLIPLVLYTMCKTVVLLPLTEYFLGHPEIFAFTEFDLLVFGYWRDLINIILFVWTYSGNYGKEGAGILLSELTTMLCTVPVLMLVNRLEGRAALQEVIGVLMPADILIPVLSGLIWLLISRSVSPLAMKFRKWVPKRRWIPWGIFIIYVLSTAKISSGVEILERGIAGFVLVHQLWGIALAGTLIYLMLLRQRQEEFRHELLVKQVQFAETCSLALKRRKEDTEEMRTQIELQMSTLREKLTSGGIPEEERIRGYIADLCRDQQKMLHGGVFCGNLSVDTVLVFWQQKLNNHGLITDFRCDGIPEELKNAEKISQILELVCAELMEQHAGVDKKCGLHAVLTKGQLVISSNVGKRWKRSRRLLLKALLREMDGSMAGEEHIVEEMFVIILPVEAD